nr:hypothetical protein [Tanacetum cinerariifolium]
QVVYDVLRNSPLFRAFQVTANVPEIYMQEFWATAKLYHNSICFKIDTRKSVLDLEAFREMLHISPRIPNQPFADLPTEEEILDFLRIHWHYVRDDALFSTIKVEELSWKSFDDEDVGSHEEGKESNESDDDNDEGSDNDSDESVKSGAGKDDDDDDDE